MSELKSSGGRGEDLWELPGLRSFVLVYPTASVWGPVAEGDLRARVVILRLSLELLIIPKMRKRKYSGAKGTEPG